MPVVSKHPTLQSALQIVGLRETGISDDSLQARRNWTLPRLFGAFTASTRARKNRSDFAPFLFSFQNPRLGPLLCCCNKVVKVRTLLRLRFPAFLRLHSFTLHFLQIRIREAAIVRVYGLRVTPFTATNSTKISEHPLSPSTTTTSLRRLAPRPHPRTTCTLQQSSNLHINHNGSSLRPPQALPHNRLLHG
jgi:hypothetical protein